MKILIAFVSLSLLPSILLFLAGSSLISQSISNLFTPSVERVKDAAFFIARSSTNQEWERNSRFAESVSEEIRAGHLLAIQHSAELEELVRRKVTEYGLAMIQVYTARGDLLAEAANPDTPLGTPVEPADELMKKTLEGHGGIDREEPVGGGMLLWSGAPVLSADQIKQVVGAVFTAAFLPEPHAAKMKLIKETYDRYEQDKLYRQRSTSYYSTVFLIITLVIVFSATWFGLYIARGITVPIHKLAAATQAVAAGNLDITVDVRARDEIGQLVQSFNKMTIDLKHNKQLVEQATVELREANLSLEQRRRFMETVFDNIATGVFSLDQLGRVTSVNRVARRMLAIAPGEALGEHYRKALGAISYRALVGLIGEAEEGVAPVLARQLTLEINQITLTATVSLARLTDADGEYRGLVVALEDLTQLIKAQRTAAWQEVARRIAHEIKNPLTPIQLSAQRLRKRLAVGDGPHHDLLEECTRTIIDEVEGLKSLVNEFSRFARMPEANPRPYELHRVIQNALALYGGVHPQVEMLTDLGPDIPVVNLDPEAMKRVFINLIDNAIEAMNGKGRIMITTRHDPAYGVVRVEVADEGTGIRPEDKAKLFVPYFSRKEKGSGLGLAIVNRIISDHGGYIRVRDNEPIGTRFVIELPAGVRTAVGWTSGA